MLEAYMRTQDAVDRLATLTHGELKIAAEMATGVGSIPIAERLQLSVLTVRTHRKAIMEKTRCKNMVEFGRLWEAGAVELSLTFGDDLSSVLETGILPVWFQCLLERFGGASCVN